VVHILLLEVVQATVYLYSVVQASSLEFTLVLGRLESDSQLHKFV